MTLLTSPFEHQLPFEHPLPVQDLLSFEHLLRLSDDTGLLEHAKGSVPRREHGYCLDDVARGLLLLSRVPDPTPHQRALADRYLAFVAHAQVRGGACRNRLSYDRRWTDDPSTEDCWGRALWALGSVVSGSGPPGQRREALDRFSLSGRCRSPWPRAAAFAALGAAEVLSVVPGDDVAQTLLAEALVTLPRPRADPSWPWPEDRLTYANAAMAEALIAAGSALGDDVAVRDGLELLIWLVELQSRDDHLSFVPAGGWSRGEPQPGFDQQPIEAAALADACTRAFTATGDRDWLVVVTQCLRWFLGSNDSNVPMHDPATGGGYDGLEPTGANLNQGAESTLAWLLTLQQGLRVAHLTC